MAEPRNVVVDATLDVTTPPSVTVQGTASIVKRVKLSTTDEAIEDLDRRVTIIESDYLKSIDELILDCGSASTDVPVET